MTPVMIGSLSAVEPARGVFFSRSRQGGRYLREGAGSWLESLWVASIPRPVLLHVSVVLTAAAAAAA